MSPTGFWQTKTLAEMDDAEWEALCDGCGKCCLHKLQDEDTDQIYYTNVACRLLDLNICRCTQYSERTNFVPECLNVKRLEISEFAWLPGTCAYRLLSEGKSLPSWHPLVSGNFESVIEAGVAIKSYAVREEEADDLEDHVISWIT